MKLTIALVCSCLFYQAFSQTETSSPQCQGSVLELVATSMQSLQSRLDKLEARPGPQVAFTAQVSVETPANNVLKYSTPLLNLGNVLNPSTGEFTAPANGMYSFSFMGLTYRDDGGATVAVMRVNGVDKITAATGSGTQYESLATGGVFILKAGDVVHIQVLAGGIRGSAESIFSGFLISGPSPMA